MATSFTYASGSNRLLGTSGGLNASYGYNADGDTKTIDGRTAYTYGVFNNLIHADGAAFTYSAEGQRLRKTFGGNTTYFAPGAGGGLQAEDLNGTWYDYVWLNGRMVTVIANGGVFPLHDDQTGRPLALTHPSTKAILWQAQDKPFDRTVTTNTWGAFNVGFPGQYWDVEDDLWHNGARDYDAQLGRYIESDPIGLKGGVNTYVYADNNPISNVDPLGLCPTCSQLQAEASQVADALEHTSHEAEAISAAGYFSAGVGAFFEPETLGLDTGVTITGASIGSVYAKRGRR